MESCNVTIDPQQIARFCQQHGVARLSLFGSTLRDDFDPTHSDVDLLAEFVPGASRNLFKLMQMQCQLTEILGRQADLTTPGSLSKYFRDQVLDKAVVLYDAA